jgi:hypothetical protein
MSGCEGETKVYPHFAIELGHSLASSFLIVFSRVRGYKIHIFLIYMFATKEKHNLGDSSCLFFYILLWTDLSLLDAGTVFLGINRLIQKVVQFFVLFDVMFWY